jgi:hypothetical protein
MLFRRLVMIAAFSIPAAASVPAAGAGALPAIDVKKSCETSEKSLVQIFGNETRITVDNCLRQEQGARQTIIDNWATYSTSDRQHCLNPKVYMPSYVEWLTCLEMYRDVRQLRNPPKGQ